MYAALTEVPDSSSARASSRLLTIIALFSREFAGEILAHIAP
jgi:hypothetical protein